jgi:hypothetical protein
VAGLVFVLGLLVVGGLLFLGASLLLGRGETQPPAEIERSPGSSASRSACWAGPAGRWCAP